MTALTKLEEVANRVSSQRATEVLQVSKHYMMGLDELFDKEPVTLTALQQFDFPGFLIKKKLLGIPPGVSMGDVYYVVRHVYSFTGSDGKHKTGQDLYRAWSTRFDSAATHPVNEVYLYLKTVVG